MPRRAFSIAVLLALLALAACGDKGPSKEEFLGKADPVCKRGNEIAVVFTTPSDVPMIKDFSTKVADNVDKTTAELNKLKFPKGDDGKAARDMVQALKDAGGAARGMAADVDAKNYPNIESGVTKMVDAFKNADNRARSFGSTECGRGENEAVGKLGTTANATVKNAYISQADAICAAAGKELDALPETDTPSEVKATLEKSGTILDKMMSDLKAIPKPNTDSSKLTDFFTTTDAFVAKFKEGPAIVASGDERRADRWFEELTVAGDTSDAKGDAYGFKDCGSQGS